MAIVNRTPDSFYDNGATFADDAALAAIGRAVAAGADIVDIGGVKAGPGPQVDAAEEIERVVPIVQSARAAHPAVVNDAWGGVDAGLLEVAGSCGAAIVCTHAGGVTPRTRPHRIAYDDVVADVVATTRELAERAVRLGVPPS